MIRVAIYLIVIAMAFTLKEKWMAVLQAAAGAFVLGMKVCELIDEK